MTTMNDSEIMVCTPIKIKSNDVNTNSQFNNKHEVANKMNLSYERFRTRKFLQLLNVKIHVETFVLGTFYSPIQYFMLELL